MECPENRYAKYKNLFLETHLRYLRTHTSSTRNNELHDCTLIKLIVSRFEGTGLSLTIANFTRIKHIDN